MATLTLQAISQLIGAKFSGVDAPFTGVAIDSRRIKKGELFIALKGQQVDGHLFIRQAEALGAAGFLVSQPIDTKLAVIELENTLQGLAQIARVYRQQFTIPIIAVTGSSGKTTVKEMLSSILKKVYKIHVTQGNYNNEIGLPLTLLGLQTTHECAVIEMGARRLTDIQYLMDIAHPTLSLITNVSTAHLEIFGSTENIAIAKGEIYKYLSPQGTAIINKDEAYVSYWKSLLTTQDIISFGMTNQADISVANFRLEATQSCFTVITPLSRAEINLPVAGLHNIKNALAAIAVAYALKIDLSIIKEGLESFQGVQSRLECKPGINGATIIDDTYNANPDSVKAALQVLQNRKGKKIFIMGDMLELGAESIKAHQDIGLYATNLSIDALYTYGILAKEAVSTFGKHAKHFTEKYDLIAAITCELEANTTVLVKGSRGMHLEEVVAELLA